MGRLYLALYTFALRAFPRRHRTAYAAEMIDTFERELLERRQGAMRFVLAACANVIVAGAGERRRYRQVGRTNVLLARLDFILAWRMMLRYPGLSLVAMFGMTVGIAIATSAFAIISTMTNAKLPLPDGDRIVSLLSADNATGHREPHMLHDVAAWRGLTAVQDIGVTRTVRRNLMLPGRAPEEITVAEISASAFRVAGVPAFRGRHLLAEDERPGAPEAIVIGHDEWVRRFERDPNIIGRSVQIGSATYAIVGVMPENFSFPLHHSYWIPWRIDANAYGPRTGPTVDVFGRLAPGATLERAQAEIATLGLEMAARLPATHEHLRAFVVPYTFAFTEMEDPGTAIGLYLIQLAIVLLLVVVSVNVAILVYARTATRLGEIAVRGALGASRQRIVAQLFVEALMLAGISAAAGIVLADTVLRQLNGSLLMIGGRVLPFWMSLQLSTDDVIYVSALTLGSATIIGVVPALKATSTSVHTRLQTLSPGSGSRMAMGRVWATLIVLQVALTVTLLPASMYQAWTALRFRTGDLGFASGEFLTTQVVLDRTAFAPTSDGDREFTAQVATRQRELDRRVREDARVSEVTFSMASVGEERAMVVEIEGRPVPAEAVDYNIAAGSKSGFLVRINRVAPNFFTAFDVPVIMGRGFQSSDASLENPASGVLVNRALVDTMFGGANPLGSRIRYVGRSREAGERDVVLDHWYEIVGVVPDFPVLRSLDTERESKIYHAAAFGDVHPVEIAIRVRGADPSAFAGPLREIGASIDPNMQVRDIATIESVLKREQGLMRLIGTTVALMMLSVIVLAAAGMYALMSFTVAQRRKEIGIRAALGANRNRLLAGIFARALGQIAIGVMLGLAGAVALEGILQGEMFQGHGTVLVPLVILVMTIVGIIAIAGPARRGLNIQPTEALREE